MKKIREIIQNLFRHNCQNHKELLASNYFKCGSSGVIFSMGKEYKCNKCGKKWVENSRDNDEDIDYFDVLMKSLPYF